jgi:Tol biopolymer transport system component
MFMLNLMFLAAVAAADAPIDRTGKWDVNGPLGPEQGSLAFTTSEGTWMNLDVHPDGDRLLFDLLGDLYLLSIDGGEAKRLTDGAAYDFQARFSPDGSQVLNT